LYGIPATAADVVAVVRRGPTNWCRLGRWDVAAGTYETGPWLGGRIYRERCDLSPDGRYFAYFAMKPSATWELGWTYIAISRLPQLTALAAWGTGGTWTRGIHFVDDPAVWEVSEPEYGALPRDLQAGIAVTRPAAYAVERRRGWVEAPGSPPRADDDLWDQRRTNLCMEKGPLRVQGRRYSVGDIELTDVQWADWSRDRRLLVATTAGELQTRDERDWTRSATIVADLSVERPR
jgi:hypothetical protein